MNTWKTMLFHDHEFVLSGLECLWSFSRVELYKFVIGITFGGISKTQLLQHHKVIFASFTELWVAVAVKIRQQAVYLSLWMREAELPEVSCPSALAICSFTVRSPLTLYVPEMKLIFFQQFVYSILLWGWFPGRLRRLGSVAKWVMLVGLENTDNRVLECIFAPRVRSVYIFVLKYHFVQHCTVVGTTELTAWMQNGHRRP